MNRFRNLMAIFATFEGDGGKGGGGKAQTEEEKEAAMEARLIRMVNAAVTSQMSRKKPDAGITEALEALAAKVDAIVSAKPEDKGDKGGPNPEIAALEAKITALTNQIAEKDSTSEADTKKHREEQLVAKIREGLGQAGVKKELLDGAVGVVRGKMTIDPKTGVVTYKKQNKGWHEDITVEAGLKDWAESDTGKAHLAPVEAGGAGTVTPAGGGGRAPIAALNPATLPTDPTARAAAVKAHKISQAKQDLRHHSAALIGGGRISLGGPAPGEGEE